ncbi:MAG: thiamine pyrophosphate-binding protein [Pseudomonadota bacterium]
MSLRAADVLAQRLYEAGCRYAFGIPGGEVLTIVDALERAGIRFVLSKHENSAGFMAEGVWQRTGAPAVLVATLGPGVANAVNVVANAEQDRVPLIFLTGCVDEDEAATYTHQVFDHQQLLRPITRDSLRLSAGAADVITGKALRAATGPRPGPVHIDVPISVAAALASPSPVPLPVSPARSGPAPSADLSSARAAIIAAERPLILAGLEALDEEAAHGVRALAETLDAPLVTTYKAKGVLPEDHRLALGGAGLSPKADTLLLPLVAQADVIVLAGYDPIEMRTGWRHPWDITKQTVVELTAHPNDHDMHTATQTFVCDVAAGLTAITPAPDERSSVAVSAWEKKWSETRASLHARFIGDTPEWGPAAAIAAARRIVPKDTIATVDSGAHRILLSQMWETHETRTLLQSTGLCTMGCAVPLALGAKLADPSRPCVAFTGDAGLLMILGELASADELELPIIVVVFVDRSLALIDIKQRQRQLSNAGVDFGRSDFAAIAEAMGGHGRTVRSTEEMETAVTSALEADRFSVIAVEIEREAYDGTF